MKNLFPITAAVAIGVGLSGPASAACFADYKAKQDAPLRLHYGVAELTLQCDPASAEAELTPRLEADGWTLLNVLAVFDEAGLDERKDRAGQYFLRY